MDRRVKTNAASVPMKEIEELQKERNDRGGQREVDRTEANVRRDDRRDDEEQQLPTKMLKKSRRASTTDGPVPQRR